MSQGIAIIGIGCCYPDARSPIELWENVLAQRRAFRQMPSERLRSEDYLSADRNAPDGTYSVEAALIEGYEFDRVHFRVAGNTFRSADLAHWLALDVASQALADAGFPEGESLPHKATGVLLGNTLTGEFSRAAGMRLRWPYVRRVVEATLIEEGWASEQRRAFVKRLEARYKEPFPPVGEETLAGGLSNTIAGRICNYFDLKGGGYTVDGACSSSLLAVATACSALVAGDLDIALAGGVDLSLDPFELVGFAKAGALALEEMRIYDVRSAGFWPGEGCGFVVLMRYEDAVTQHRGIYAIIRGWGVSSDGSGGITRPEVEGQLLALRRAYQRAGFGIETVTYFEGHGTGTSVGDTTELRVLSRARREVALGAPPAVIGSIKANIGHTKAAAGVAGLIKATMALHTQILPPTTGCEKPHSELTREGHALQVLSKGELWPSNRPLRAGVSAMGFGGINTHVVLEGIAAERRKTLSSQERVLLSSAQDAELLLMGGRDVDDLRQQVEHMLTFAARLSRAEIADLAAQLEKVLNAHHVRAAVVASSPMELVGRLEMLRSWLTNEVAVRLDIPSGVFLGRGTTRPRLGFLFPGQGSPTHLSGGVLGHRFECVQELYTRANLPADGDGTVTAVAQPAIVTASLAALRVLDKLGVTAYAAIGHSLGELTALHWAGALDESSLLRIAVARGKAMAEVSGPAGAMASIGAGQAEVEALLEGTSVVIAGLNSPRQTVISGETSAVAAVIARARARNLRAVNLPVSHAFHSPLVAAAAPVLAEQLTRGRFHPLQRRVVSTVTGTTLAPDEDLQVLLYRQVTAPVRFMEAVAAIIKGIDLFIEVGPGRVLSGLITEFIDTPTVALDAGGPSLKGLLQAVGAAFALGTPINPKRLFAERFVRPFHLDWHPRFFANPCERAPVSEMVMQRSDRETQERENTEVIVDSPSCSFPVSPLDLVRQLVAERAELPSSAVKEDSSLLGDLHLNSITVSQLVAEAARRLGLPPPIAPIDYADATVIEVAQALEELLHTGSSLPIDEKRRLPSGVDSWIRAFTVELVERPLPHRQLPTGVGTWQVIAPPDHPLKDPLKQAFTCLGGGHGIILCLPPEPDERHVGLLLEGARAVLAEKETTRFVLVQHGGGAASLARTLHLEVPEVTTCVVDVPPNLLKATEWILAEARAAVGYSEAYYDTSGKRREPVLRLLPLFEESTELPLGPDDVLLVTGGGKGIAAECALSLARETRARLALLGRSQPIADCELAANLERITAEGIDFRYISVDVTDREAVQKAVEEAVIALGRPVTAILHGAGTNVPQLLSSLDEMAFLRTLAPKVQGAHNLLAAVDLDYLRLFVTFGSIIARTGLRGEADYALANEWLTRLTERLQVGHPHCRCLAVEWSVWSGVGMGQRLGRVDALMQQGITPIPPDEGKRLLCCLLNQRLPSVSVVVTGRFGEVPTLKMEQPDLPFLRFLERPRVYYPGVELVVDTELSTTTDPYLDDHKFRGERLFPAVMGLEAMAQVVMALGETSEPPIFEDVKFTRPIVVAEGNSTKIRIAALVRKPGQIEVVLRSGETHFQVDYFRATCWVGNQKLETGNLSKLLFAPGDAASYVPINPERDLYGGILFHGRRFRRLRGYRQLKATECFAEIAPNGVTDWFGRYLPARLVLGDPAARDAAIHAIQACIPHMTLLPVEVDRLILSPAQTPGSHFVQARERSREGDTFIYDLEVATADGYTQERWEGLRLQRIGGTVFQGPWVEPLLGPYIERRIPELIPGTAATVVIERNATPKRHSRNDRLIHWILGKHLTIRRRPDGKPEVPTHPEVNLSMAHTGDLTMAAASPELIGCDIEPVVARPASMWQDLLGPERLMLTKVIAQEGNEDQNIAATRVWSATECLKKAGATVDIPLVLASLAADGWVLLAAGSLIIATFVAQIRNMESRLVLAVLVKNKGPIYTCL